jgi:hypothetical protein
LLRVHRPIVFSEFGPAGLRERSGAPPEEYLKFLTDLGYELAVLRPDGDPVSCGGRHVAVMERVTEAHVDIVAFDPVRHAHVVS